MTRDELETIKQRLHKVLQRSTSAVLFFEGCVNWPGFESVSVEEFLCRVADLLSAEVEILHVQIDMQGLPQPLPVPPQQAPVTTDDDSGPMKIEPLIPPNQPSVTCPYCGCSYLMGHTHACCGRAGHPLHPETSGGF